MERFMLLYEGPPTPASASHEGWPEWFAKLGDKLLEQGSPLANARVLHGDGSTSGSGAHLNGYSIIQADDVDEVLSMVRDHPFLKQGDEYSIEIHSLP